MFFSRSSYLAPFINPYWIPDGELKMQEKTSPVKFVQTIWASSSTFFTNWPRLSIFLAILRLFAWTGTSEIENTLVNM